MSEMFVENHGPLSTEAIAALVKGAKEVAAKYEKTAYVYFDMHGNWHVSTKRPGDLWLIRAYPDGRTEGRGMFAEVTP